MKKPYVYLCTGMSLDGKLSNYKHIQSPIGENDDMSILYDSRIRADAVMVGGNTLRQDDPGLSVKTVERQTKRKELNKSAEPTKVGILSNLIDLKSDSQFLNKSSGNKIIFTTTNTLSEDIERIQEKATVHVVGNTKVNLVKVMEILYDEGIKALMVEGGGELIYSLFSEDLIDEVNLTIGNYIIGGRNSVTFVEGEGFDILNYKKINFVSVIQKDNLIVVKGLVKK